MMDSKLLEEDVQDNQEEDVYRTLARRNAVGEGESGSTRNYLICTTKNGKLFPYKEIVW